MRLNIKAFNHEKFSFNQEKFGINFLLFLVYIIALFPLTKIGFTVGDDIDLYTETCKGHWNHVIGNLPYLHGRFYLLFSRYVNTVPYLIDSRVYFDLMYIFPIALSFILFSRLIQRVFNNDSISLFAAIFFASCFQIAGFHSITTAYPFFFTFSFCLILISLHLFISFYEKRKKYLLYFSAIIMLIATLFYETYMLYYFVFLIIAIWKNNNLYLRTKENWIKTFKELTPFIIGGGLYLIAYFGFQIFFPPKYNGAYISKDLTLLGLLQTATLMSKLSFPLQTFSDYNGLLYHRAMSLDGIFKIYRIDLIIAVQGLIVIALAYYSMNKYKAIKYINLLWGFIIGICLVYLPLILVSASSRYYMKNWHSYVPTFFSYFGYTLCFVMLLFAILNLLSFSKITRHVFQVIICFILFWVTAITQTTNKAVSEDLELSSFRLEMADFAVKKDAIPNLTTKTPICFEEAHKTSSTMGQWVTTQYFSWKDYFVKQVGKKYNFIDYYDEFVKKYKKEDKVWVCFFRQTTKTNDAIMYFACLKGNELPKLQDNIVCDTIIALYHSPYKTYNISIASKNSNDSVYINKIPINNIGNFHSANISFPPVKGQGCTVFQLTGKSLIASTLSISNTLSSEEIKQTKSSIKLTRKEKIDEIIIEIKNTPSWLNEIKNKAKARNQTLDEAIRKDAQWLYDNKLNEIQKQN